MITCSKLIDWIKIVVLSALVIYIPLVTGALWYLLVGMWTSQLNTSFFKIWSIGFITIVTATIALTAIIMTLLNMANRINKNKKIK
jgi:hypothetical protein